MTNPFNRINWLLKGHPWLTEDQARLLLCFGYAKRKDMQQWTESLFLMDQKLLKEILDFVQYSINNPHIGDANNTKDFDNNTPFK